MRGIFRCKNLSHIYLFLLYLLINNRLHTEALKTESTKSDSNIVFIPDVTALDITVGDVGTNVICSYTALPSALNTTWLKGETEVIVAGHGDVFQIHDSLSSSRLFFSQTVKTSDTGTYTCRVFTSSLTTANRDLSVNVKETCDATPVNGLTNCTEIVNITTVCSISCFDGYYIDFPELSTCVSQDNWQPDFSTRCKPITCTDSPDLEFGKERADCTATGNSYMERCELMCIDGYYISGDLEASCQDTNMNNDTNANGEWNTTSTKCFAIMCVDSPFLTNGISANDCNSSNYLDTCNLTCNDGYFLSGFSNATCIDINVNNDTNQVGLWDTENTECIAIACTDAPVLEFGKEATNCTENSYMDKCELMCNDGYYISGDLEAPCQDPNMNDDANMLGEWNTNNTECIAISCFGSPSISNGVSASDCSPASFLDTCDFTCYDGYFLSGFLSAICTDVNAGNDTNQVGRWDAENTECRVITCTDPPDLEHGKQAANCTTTNNSYMDICELMCNDGYYISGDLEASCQDTNVNDDTNMNGKWTIEDTKCTAITCLEPPSLANGHSVNDCSSAKYLDTCDLTCGDGYFLSGNSKATCIDKNTGYDLNQFGRWDTESAECIQFFCTLELPENSLSNCQEIVSVNTSCTFECESGFSATGNEQRICEDVGESNGVWNIGWESASCEKDQTTKPPPETTTGGVESSTLVIVSSIAGVCGILLILSVVLAICFYKKWKSEKKKDEKHRDLILENENEKEFADIDETMFEHDIQSSKLSPEENEKNVVVAL